MPSPTLASISPLLKASSTRRGLLLIHPRPSARISSNLSPARVILPSSSSHLSARSASSTPKPKHASSVLPPLHPKRSISTSQTNRHPSSSGGAKTASLPSEETIEVTDQMVGSTLSQALSQIKLVSPKPLCARSDSGRLLSLNSTIPPGTKSLRPIHFLTEDDDSARNIFWLSSSYLLAAALVKTLGGPESGLLLGAGPNLNSRGSGGMGFSYDFLLAPGRSDRDGGASSSSKSRDLGSIFEEIHSLLEQQASDSSTTTSHLEWNEKLFAELESNFEKLRSSQLEFKVGTMTRSEAELEFGSNPFKLERLSALKGDEVAVVRIGESFVDLLPESEEERILLPSTKPLKVLKVMDRSACTFVASSLENQARLESLGSPKANRQSLSRLRCVSFPTSAQLKSYLNGLKEAAESDHRAIGKAQALFLTHESSPGTPFILPNGMKIARKMERVIRDLYDQNEYQEVQSPQLYRSSLWKTSGHWDNYRDDMFCSEGYKERSERSRSSSAWMEKAKVAEEVDRERGGCCSAHSEKASSSSEPKREEGREKEEQDEESFGLKPMNCPGHCLIFSSQTRSYRDLPIRFAEFSPLHRNESSGSLSGLTRVRRFHQDDAHVFCTPSQISGEIAKMLEMLSSAYETFGFRDFELALSTRPATNFIGEEEEWERAEEALRKALDGTGRVWEVNRGDGAFYGPKIDIRLVDSAGRKHQTATIQLDFQLPRRFELSYLDRDGETKVPVMIHRAILGSVERFMAILIESTAGFWPFWINPLQAVILPTNHDPEVKLFAEKVRHLLSLGDQADLLLHSLDERVETLGLKRRNLQKLNVDLWTGSDRTLSKSVRKAQMQRYNFIIFVGPKEVEQGRVTLRMRQEPSGGGGGGGVKSEFKAWLRSKIESGHTFSPKELRDIFCFMDSCHI